jgi:hypothetical protein
MSTVESVEYKAIRAKAEEIDKKLTAYDFGNGVVLVEHDDGSRFFLTHAILFKEDNWWIVFTEHHGIHIFHDEDCTVRTYEVPQSSCGGGCGDCGGCE